MHATYKISIVILDSYKIYNSNRFMCHHTYLKIKLIYPDDDYRSYVVFMPAASVQTVLFHLKVVLYFHGHN